jgi:hypothetical protein
MSKQRPLPAVIRATFQEPTRTPAGKAFGNRHQYSRNTGKKEQDMQVNEMSWEDAARDVISETRRLLALIEQSSQTSNQRQLREASQALLRSIEIMVRLLDEADGEPR